MSSLLRLPNRPSNFGRQLLFHDIECMELLEDVIPQLSCQKKFLLIESISLQINLGRWN